VRRVVYRLLRKFSVLDRWLRERLTPAGWLVLGAAGAAAAGGIDLNQTLTAQAFTFLASLLLLALTGVATPVAAEGPPAAAPLPTRAAARFGKVSTPCSRKSGSAAR